MADGAPLGSASVSNGAAQITSSALSAGTHIITAAYSGDAHLGSSTGTLSLLVNPSDFLLHVTPSALTLPSSGSGTVQVTLSSLGGYAGSLTLQATGMPANLGGVFASPIIALQPQGSGATTLTLTPRLTAAMHPPAQPGTAAPRLAVLAFLAGVPVLLRRRRSAPSLCGTALVAVALLGSLGCSTVGNPFYPVSPGSYTLQITATDPVTHRAKTAVLPLTITPGAAAAHSKRTPGSTLRT